MRYIGDVYRPPSEWNSLIVQATVGCSHNKCTFCNMYKSKTFKIRTVEDICEDLESLKCLYGDSGKKVFLADGNALMIKTDDFKKILLSISSKFPSCKRVGVYASPMDILRKSIDELKDLKAHGLGIVYLGIESGSDLVLKSVNKGVTTNEMVKAGNQIKEAGLILSVMIISGLGGVQHWKSHALESARVINAIQPHYLSLLTLLENEGTELKAAIDKGEFLVMSPLQVLEETRLFISSLILKRTVFRSNHISNYLSLEGNLPEDQEYLLNQLQRHLKHVGDIDLNSFRRL